MDYALLNLVVTFVLLVVTFAFRKRILTGISRVIGPYVVQSVATWAFTTEEVEQEDGTHVKIKALSAPAKAFLAATVPVLIAEVAKNVKLKMPHGPTGLPEGLDLSNLSSAIPALLGSGMIPKKYAGLVALAAPFLQGFMGGKGVESKPLGGPSSGSSAMSEITKKLIP